MNPPTIVSAFAMWSLLVLANYSAGHPSLLNADWLEKSFLPPCPSWDAPFLGDRILQLAGSAALVTGFLATAHAAGRMLSRWIRLPVPEPVGLILGMGALSLGWLGLGLGGVWFGSIAWVMLAAGTAAGGRSLLRGIRVRPGWWMLAAVPAAWVTLAGALAPETELDAARYHLGLPALFIAHHKIFVPERMMFASFPLNASMAFGAVGLIGGQPAAKLLNWTLLWITGALAMQLTGGGLAGRLAALFWICVPVVWVHAAMGFAELTTAAYLTAALVLLRDGRSRITGSAILAGFALGTSYRAVQGAVPLALLWLVATRRIGAMAGFGAVSGLVVLPWGLKNWLMMGNPVHPVFSGMLGSREDETRSLARSVFRLADVLPAGAGPLTGGWLYLVPGDRGSSYPVGPVIAMLVPFVLAAAITRRSVPAAFALLFAGVWTATTPGWSRYLIGALPAACAAAGALISAGLPSAGAIRSSAIALGVATAVACTALSAETVFRRNHPVPHACGCESSREYLAGRIAPPPHGAAILKLADRTLPGSSRIYSWGAVTTAFSPREGHADYEHSTPLFQLIVRDSTDPGTIRKRFRQRGLDAFLYDISGGVSQSASSDLMPWTPRMTEVWQSFIRRYLVLTERIEVEKDNAYLHVYTIRRAPDPRARLPRGTTWPHLPGMERILAPGDIAYDAKDLRGALSRYESAARDHPGYAWAWQRISIVAKELGQSGKAAAAGSKLRMLGG